MVPKLFKVGAGNQGFPGGSDGKESAGNAGDLGSIPGSGRSISWEIFMSLLLFSKGHWMAHKGPIHRQSFGLGEAN